mgnify:CR=1 FL=1|tara:strand:- start:297 stop:476 length:180 start_codon:yes stop_codon:yes gene_type:complete
MDKILEENINEELSRYYLPDDVKTLLNEIKNYYRQEMDKDQIETLVQTIIKIKPKANED